ARSAGVTRRLAQRLSQPAGARLPDRGGRAHLRLAAGHRPGDDPDRDGGGRASVDHAGDRGRV
ncbi:MAG: hypothetical protein AVDCRST_MAG45-912, partial [uncultured Solirubrobacterales bacterium]